MALPFKEQPTYYFDKGNYWLVAEDKLWQFNEGFFLEWTTGTEMHYYKKKELKELKPVPDSLGEHVLKMVVEKIKSSFPVKELISQDQTY